MRPILIEEIRREKCNQSMLSGYNQAVASGLIEQGEKMPEDIAEEYDNTINRGLGHEYEKYVNVQGMEIDKGFSFIYSLITITNYLYNNQLFNNVLFIHK